MQGLYSVLEVHPFRFLANIQGSTVQGWTANLSMGCLYESLFCLKFGKTTVLRIDHGESSKDDTLECVRLSAVLLFFWSD